jgi:molybdate transport system permease protein
VISSEPTARDGTAVHRRVFGAVLFFALALALGFFVLPIVAIFARISWGELVGQLGNDVARDALIVTAKTNGIAFALTLLVGTPAAYLLALRRFPGRSLLITLVELPLVLPPAVAGIGLLVAFGRLGLLGDSFDALGISIGFTQAAVVLAVLFVAGPFYFRQAIAAFESLDRDLVDAARTLGSAPARTFLRVALPLASGGLAAGAALCFARGVGEFGATLIFAGSLQGVTQTVTLAIYEQLEIDLDTALAISALLVVVSAAVLLTAKLVPARRRSSSTSPFGFGISSFE